MNGEPFPSEQLMSCGADERPARLLDCELLNLSGVELRHGVYGMSFGEFAGRLKPRFAGLQRDYQHIVDGA